MTFRAQGTGHRAQGTGHRARGTGHRAQSTGHRAQSTEHRAQSTEQDRKTVFSAFCRTNGSSVFGIGRELIMNLVHFRD
ncbi:MAG: hypothetical protein IPI69_00750 [Bacteroidales bacterium]|nr:hypothetical protein [Bacteroidales bacterium]